MIIERKATEITLEEMKEMVQRMKLNGANMCYLDININYNYFIDNIEFDAYDDSKYLDTMLTLNLK